MIVTWAEKVEGRGRAKSSCPRNNCVLVYRYTKEGNINELRHNSMYGYENKRNSLVYRYTRTAPNFPCDQTYFKEGNYFDGYGGCKGIYFDNYSLLSTFSCMTSLDVYFDAHATQLELSFRTDVWRAFTYLHVWDKAFLDKKRVFV